jgi:hypothetical protein
MVLVRPTLAAALVIVLAGCGQSGSVPTASSGAASAPAPTAKPAVAALATLTRTAAVTDLTGPASIVATADGVWVLQHSVSRLVKIDPATNLVAADIAVGTGYSNGLGLAGGRLWTFNQTTGAVLGVDPASAKVAETVEAGADGDLFAVGDGAAWLISGGSLVRVDGATAKVATYPIPAACEAAGLAVGGGYVWIASSGGSLCKVDEKSGKLIQQGTGAGLGAGITIVNGAPWLPGADDGLSIVDATTLAEATALPPPLPGSFEGSTYSLGRAAENTVIAGAADGKTGWVRYTGATIGRVTVGADPAIVLYAGFPADILGGGILEAFDSLWVANFGAGTVERYELPTQ